MSTSVETLKAAKSQLRREAKNRVKQLTEDSMRSQSSMVCNRLLNSDAYKNSKRISMFLSMNDEIRTEDMMKQMFRDDKILFIPKYDKKSSHMDMVELHSLEDFQLLPSTDWNIKQPKHDDLRPDALTTGGLNLILVPGLAFTKSGLRTGRGRGYYDTYLTRCNDAFQKRIITAMPLTVGLAFNEQMFDSLPVSEQDYVLDDVLYPDKQK
ncbi:MTHFS (predicted) [Pycnogonum litorale]